MPWIAELERADVRARLESQWLPRYLLRQRWYGAKDAGAPATALACFAPFAYGGADAALALVRATPPGQAPQDYFLPLAPAAGGAADADAIGELTPGGRAVRIVDAVADDRFIRALLAGIRDGARWNGLGFRRTSAFRDQAQAPIERLRAEQSNTSLRIGASMLKVLRRIHPGVHPEIEITGYLTERTLFRNCASLLGAVEWTGDGEARVLCALQSMIPNRGDGWRFVRERLLRVIAEDAPEERAALVALASQLGRRTAELHRALAGASDDAAFAPEPITPGHLAQWRAQVGEQARRAITGLRRAAPDLAGATAGLAGALMSHQAALARRIDELTAEPVKGQLTRLHNDYHLGQVLVSGDDVYIVDFEGEPLRPLAERRAKHSALRDVAGMLRSFSYAAAAAVRALPSPAPADAAARLDALASGMSQAFLGFYQDTMGDCPSFPPEPQARRLLELFLLEKALYEVNYELANRPDWVDIPLAGVVALLEGVSSDAHH